MGRAAASPVTALVLPRSVRTDLAEVGLMTTTHTILGMRVRRDRGGLVAVTTQTQITASRSVESQM